MLDTATSEAHAGAAGKIGPNAITQLLAALRAAGLDLDAAEIFAAAGAADWLADPPGSMVAEDRVARVHQRLRAMMTGSRARCVLREAGRLTAEYLLAHRIPRAARLVLKRLPARLAAALLVRAIQAHAWTFAGTGRFSVVTRPRTRFHIRGNPFCRGEQADAPVCAWHAAVFQRLFAALVSPNARAVETECEARGDPCCCFVVTWET